MTTDERVTIAPTVTAAAALAALVIDAWREPWTTTEIAEAPDRVWLTGPDGERLTLIITAGRVDVVAWEPAGWVPRFPALRRRITVGRDKGAVRIAGEIRWRLLHPYREALPAARVWQERYEFGRRYESALLGAVAGQMQPLGGLEFDELGRDVRACRYGSHAGQLRVDVTDAGDQDPRAPQRISMQVPWFAVQDVVAAVVAVLTAPRCERCHGIVSAPADAVLCASCGAA